jgi:hypothetical protein
LPALNIKGDAFQAQKHPKPQKSMTEIPALLQSIAPVVSAMILQQDAIHGMLIGNGRIKMQ